MPENSLEKQEIILRPEFIEECDALIVETVFDSRWALISGYWMLGKLIRGESKGLSITDFTERLAVALGKSRRLLWYTVQFYDAYPHIDELPEGKNISWNKIITKYLPTSKKGKEEQEWECPNCHYKGNSYVFKL